MPAPDIVAEADGFDAGSAERPLRSVLVIDSDPLVARSLELMLTAERFAVQIAASGAEGLALARLQAFNLVILGADMLDIAGQDAARQIRLASPASAIVFASVSPATRTSNATLQLSDCT